LTSTLFCIHLIIVCLRAIPEIYKNGEKKEVYSENVVFRIKKISQMDALREFCKTQQRYLPISYEEIVFTLDRNTYFYLTPKFAGARESGVLHFQFFENGREIKLLPDLYNIGFPINSKNHVQLFKNVLQYYWNIIQEEYSAVQQLIDQDEKDCYYSNFYAFDEFQKKESFSIRKNRILKEINNIDFEKMGMKFTKSKVFTECKTHVYVKFHSTYWMLRIRESNAKRTDILMPTSVQHTCYFIEHFLKEFFLQRIK
jgi:hypothetical protein